MARDKNGAFFYEISNEIFSDQAVFVYVTYKYPNYHTSRIHFSTYDS
jgi:hypothetical protein